MRARLAVAALVWLACAPAAQARAAKRSRRAQAQAQSARRKQAKRAQEKARAQKRREEQRRLARLRALRRRGYGLAGRSVRHSVAATGSVLPRPQAESLAAPKIQDEASARLEGLVAPPHPASPAAGVDARGVQPMSDAERASAQRRPEAQWPQGLAKNAAAPPAPQLAEMPGGGFLDKLGAALSQRWGAQTQPTIDALKTAAQNHHLSKSQTLKVAGLIDKESNGRYWLDHGTGRIGRRKYTSTAKGPMQVVCGTALEVGFRNCRDLLDPQLGVEAGVRYFLRVGGVLQRYYASKSPRANNAYAADVIRKANKIARMIDI